MKEHIQRAEIESIPSVIGGVEKEAGRRPAGVSTPTAPPDPEVRVRAKRRYFTADNKLRILDEADRCKDDGQLGALLRREGLYSSHISNWRAERRAGALVALAARKRGRKGPDPEARKAEEENQRLRKENERLKRELDYAKLLIDIQKKASEILGIPLKSRDDEGSDS
jgi:transposase